MPELTKAVEAARNWRVTQRHFVAVHGTNKLAVSPGELDFMLADYAAIQPLARAARTVLGNWEGGDLAGAVRQLSAALDGEQPPTAYPVKLYRHKTDGGAEYLTDKFIDCPNGEKEGVFEGANFIVRLDGEPEVLTAPQQYDGKFLPSLTAAATRAADKAIAPKPRQFWIAVYSHRHGTDVDAYFDVEPSEDDVIARINTSGADYEPEREESIEIRGPYEVPAC